MKVYEILRCSTLKQAEESKTGLKGQRRRIAEFRRQFNLPKGQEIVDIGKSAREHLQIKDGNLGKLLRRLEKNKNKYVLVKNVSFFLFTKRVYNINIYKAFVHI